jgi:photosystem II stability/assembly factor-like uncharacterized protein
VIYLTKRLRRVTAVVATLLVAVGITLAAGSTPAGASSPAWLAVPTFPASAVQVPNGISCPSSTTCVTVGSRTDPVLGTVAGAARTTDGGATWTTSVVPSGTYELDSVVCTSMTTCLAVGRGASDGAPHVDRTTDAGAHWSDMTAPAITYLRGIACTSALHCVIVGNGIASTSDGGTTWTVPIATPGNTPLVSIACPTTLHCVAVGNPGSTSPSAIDTSADGGATWTSRTVPAGNIYLQSVACSSATACVAAGSNWLLGSQDGGVTWTPVRPSNYFTGFGSVTCTTTGTCVATGNVDRANVFTGIVLVSHDGGVTWNPQPAPGGAWWYLAVACTSSTSCTAVGQGPTGGVAMSGPGTDESAVSLTTTSLPVALVAQQYTGQLTATGGTGPYLWQVLDGSLPTGLTLDAYSGQITGSPTAPGTATVTFAAVDAVGGEATATVPITFAAPPLVIATSSLPQGAVGVPYAATMQATGGDPPLAWAITSGTLPSGLGFDGTTGAFFGTPTAMGTQNLTVQVTDALATTTSVPLALVIGPAPLVVATTTPTPSHVGSPYSWTLGVTGGIAPYHWSLTSGSLPAGLTLDASTGTIGGTPTEVTSGTIGVTVTDAVGTSASASLPFSSSIATLLITTSSLPIGIVGSPYSATLRAQDGNPPYTWKVLSGKLPHGLHLNKATGLISGTPSKRAVSATVTFEVLDTKVGKPKTRNANTRSLAILISP